VSRDEAPIKPRKKKRQILLDIEEQRKTCSRCDVRKHFDEFPDRPKMTDGKSSWCKDCTRAGARTAQAQRKGRDRHLRNTYGITLATYESILAGQGGGCAICGSRETFRNKKTGTKHSLHVDHCHESGVVRGILCGRCNASLAMFSDSKEALLKAIAYLEKG